MINDDQIVNLSTEKLLDLINSIHVPGEEQLENNLLPTQNIGQTNDENVLDSGSYETVEELSNNFTTKDIIDDEASTVNLEDPFNIPINDNVQNAEDPFNTSLPTENSSFNKENNDIKYPQSFYLKGSYPIFEYNWKTDRYENCDETRKKQDTSHQYCTLNLGRSYLNGFFRSDVHTICLSLNDFAALKKFTPKKVIEVDPTPIKRLQNNGRTSVDNQPPLFLNIAPSDLLFKLDEKGQQYFHKNSSADLRSRICNAFERVGFYVDRYFNYSSDGVYITLSVPDYQFLMSNFGNTERFSKLMHPYRIEPKKMDRELFRNYINQNANQVPSFLKNNSMFFDSEVNNESNQSDNLNNNINNNNNNNNI